MASIFTKFFGRTVSEAAAYAAGVATAPVLHPIVRDLENLTWQLHPDVPLDAKTAAAVAAEDVDQLDAMATEASYNGINSHRFLDIYGETLNAPGVGELLAVLRRNTITADDFTHGLRKGKLETRWDAALADLQHVRLSPQQLALGIVRSVVPDPGLLAATLDLSGGVVPAYPEWPGDVLAEALAGGIDRDRLRVMVGEIGLPMSAQQAASAFFRDIIHHGDFNRAILEGDTRPEWAPYILEQARQILSANQYAELQLRGFEDRATRLADTAKHGMSAEDSDKLYNVLGRGLAVHAVTTGLARGGHLGGDYSTIPEPYRSALQRSNIRPEWADLAYSNRYSYPSAFVVRALLTDGALTEAEGEQIFLNIGYPPALAHTVAAHYAGTTTAVADPHVKRAETQLWSQAHRSYVAEEVDAGTVTPALTAAGVAAAAVPEVLALWDAERALIRKQLTPAQIRKAVKAAVLNPATGVPWTVADAMAALLARGYSQADATTFMEEI